MLCFQTAFQLQSQTLKRIIFWSLKSKTAYWRNTHIYVLIIFEGRIIIGCSRSLRWPWWLMTDFRRLLSMSRNEDDRGRPKEHRVKFFPEEDIECQNNWFTKKIIMYLWTQTRIVLVFDSSLKIKFVIILICYMIHCKEKLMGCGIWSLSPARVPLLFSCFL